MPSELVTYPLLGEVAEAELPLPAGPDPLVRPVIPADAGLKPPPGYTAAELAELAVLTSPLRLYMAGRPGWTGPEWLVVDAPNMLERLRSDRRLYLEEVQDKADAHWRSTGAYRMAQDAAFAEAREAAEDRAYDRARAEKRGVLATNRMQQLLDHGLSFTEASAQVSQEFPEEG